MYVLAHEQEMRRLIGTVEALRAPPGLVVAQSLAMGPKLGGALEDAGRLLELLPQARAEALSTCAS